MQFKIIRFARRCKQALAFFYLSEAVVSLNLLIRGTEEMVKEGCEEPLDCRLMGFRKVSGNIGRKKEMRLLETSEKK